MAYYYKLRDRVFNELGSKCGCGEAEKELIQIIWVGKGNRPKSYGYSTVYNLILKDEKERSNWRLFCWRCLKAAGKLRVERESKAKFSIINHLEDNTPPVLDEEAWCPNVNAPNSEDGIE